MNIIIPIIWRMLPSSSQSRSVCNNNPSPSSRWEHHLKAVQVRCWSHFLLAIQIILTEETLPAAWLYRGVVSGNGRSVSLAINSCDQRRRVFVKLSWACAFPVALTIPWSINGSKRVGSPREIDARTEPPIIWRQNSRLRINPSCPCHSLLCLHFYYEDQDICASSSVLPVLVHALLMIVIYERSRWRAQGEKSDNNKGVIILVIAHTE